MTSPTRNSHHVRGGAAAAVTMSMAAVLLIAGGANHRWRSGDTKVLVDGVSGLTVCPAPLQTCPSVSKFTLLQQIPAWLFHLLGLSESGNIGALMWLNAAVVTAAVTGTVVWAYRRNGPASAVLAGLLLSCGMLLPYTAQSFGEPLAAAAWIGVAVSALRRDRASTYLLGFALLATISKETAAPFVFLLALAGLGLSGATLPVLKAAVIRLTIGVAVGELLNVVFNVARYGSVFNTAYLGEPTAPAAMWASNGFGMLVSPNAGILWFWPGAVIAIAVLVTAAIRSGGRSPEARRTRAGAVAGLTVLVVTVASLATWWAPFGWYAWGPRLLMPVMAGVLILALPLIERQRLRHSWLSLPGTIALGVVSALAVLPNIAIAFRSGPYISQITGSWRTMPICAPGHPNRPQALTNACGRLATWSPEDAPLIRSVQQAGHLWQFWVAIGVTWLGIAVALLLAYRAARTTLPRRDSSGRDVTTAVPTDGDQRGVHQPTATVSRRPNSAAR